MADDIIARATTRMTRLRVEQHGAQRHLKFERDTDAIQSAIDMRSPHSLVMANLRYMMGILLFIPRPEKILILGVGAGSLIHFLRHHLPQAHITGVEYDAEMLEFAQQHVGLPRADDRLLYVIEEARQFLKIDQNRYDLILVDIFDGGVSPPWLLQKPVTDLLQQRLVQKGALAYNLLVEREKDFKRFYPLLRSRYNKQTLCLETEEYANILVYGLNFSGPVLGMNELLERCATLSGDYDLPFNEIVAALFTFNPQGAGVI